MKKISLFIFTLSLLTFMSFAQNPEFKVKKFSHEQNSMLARINSNLRLDDNDEACALILVRTAETGLGFTANTGIVGTAEWKNGDYWVYVSEGTRSLKIFKQGIKTIEYLFDIIPKTRETYLLELEVIRPEPTVTLLPVTIITTPENAKLTIDEKIVSRQNPTIELSEGEHSILLEMPGYEKLEKTILVSRSSAYFNFSLNEISNVALMIESNPSGADFYLDGIKLGQTPFSIFYPPGTYQVKVVKDGYITLENQSLIVAAPQTRKSFTLEENVGYLTINTFETAKVYIDGKEQSNTKNIKLAVQLHNIKVSMPKAKDVEKQLVIQRNAKLSLDLYPEVQIGSIQLAVTPFDADIEITGDAGEHYTAKGMHIFRDIPVGQYMLKVKAEGFRTETKTLNLTANQVLNQSIKLDEGVSGDIEMVFVQGDTFQMGQPYPNIVGKGYSKDEQPVHNVTVNDFYIGKYEVTQKQWIDIMGSNPSYFKGDDLPVERVSWNDIQEFIKKLNQITGINYRLPTEAEWEYAARGGVSASSTTFSGSSTIDEVAWYNENSGSKAHPIGTKKTNELGIYDMSGNVWEWCNDWYNADYYKNSPQNNPQGPLSGANRVNRGGSWNNDAQICRVANRDRHNPDSSGINLGFRLALSF